VRLHLLAGDAERASILVFVGELMLNPESTHYVPTRSLYGSDEDDYDTSCK
jgi:hypothetical protein